MARASDKPSSLVKKGDSSFDRGDYKEAVSFYSKAMRKSGAGSPELAAAYNGMGHTLRSLGQFKKALGYQEKALAIYRKLAKSGKPVNKGLVTALHFNADVLADLGQTDRALKLAREELGIARKIYSKNKKDVFYIICGLQAVACRLKDKRDLSAAIKLLNESIRIQKRDKVQNADKRCRNLSWAYHVLGESQLQNGDVDGAISNLRKALDMRLVITDKNKRFIGALRNTLEALSIAYSIKNNTKAKRNAIFYL